MRELDLCSGPWVGYWNRAELRGHMRLILQFSGGNIGGSGRDQTGEFDVAGAYTPDGAVTLTKSYRKRRVHYRGTWDGALIAGDWIIREEYFADMGTYEIWPETGDTETALEELVEMSADLSP